MLKCLSKMKNFKFTSNKNSFNFISNKEIKVKEEVNTAHIEELAQNVKDFDKRAFLKVLGVAGLGIAATSLFPKKSEALIVGSTPTSNVVGVRDIANNKINPAKEDGNLANIKTNTDKFTFDGSNNLLTKSAVTVSNTSNTQINPATEEGLANIGNSVNDQSIWMLRKILVLLKPLGMTTGTGSNRLSVDINTGNIAISSGTVTTVTTVATVNNLASIGGVNSFTLMKDTSRNAYANSIRTKVSF